MTPYTSQTTILDELLTVCEKHGRDVSFDLYHEATGWRIVINSRDPPRRPNVSAADSHEVL